MHHVEAPGTLKVTAGSKSSVESEDIKMLREENTAMKARLDNLEPRVGQLEPKVATALSQDTQLAVMVEDVRVNLTNALGKKISACQLCARRFFDPDYTKAVQACFSWSDNLSWTMKSPLTQAASTPTIGMWSSVFTESWIIVCKP